MPCFSEQRNSAGARSIVWIFLVIFHCCRYNEGDETVWRAGCGIYRHAVSVHGTDTERNLPHMSNQILLTISILISNRPDTVRKCLDSIQPLLKKVPSELILVDTGCGEQVRGIIEEYTDKIVDFEWCRDFSKARNAGLERARGRWFMYMDDDEWFEDVTDIIRFFNSGEYRIYGVGLYSVHNYVSLEGTDYTEMLVGRMVRLEPDIRFIYRIHECFSRAPGKAKRLNAFVHHYSYIYQTEEKAREHAMRNVSLLLEELEEHPRNMRVTLQLAQEYNSLHDREKSLELSLHAIGLAESGPVEEDYCLSSIYGNVVNCYMTQYSYDEAIEKGEQYIESSQTDRMVKAVIAGRLAIAFVDKEKYEKALHYTAFYWQVYQEYLKNRDAFMTFDTPVTNTCFHERKRTPVLGNGVRAAVHCGKGDLAWTWFRDMNWQWDIYELDMGVVRDILERMPQAGEQELAYYEKMCSELVKRPELEEFIVETIMENCNPEETIPGEKRESEFTDRIGNAAAYRNVASGHWSLKLIRLTTAAFGPEPGISYTAEEAEDTALELWKIREQTMSWMKAYDIAGAVRHFGGRFAHVMEAVSFPQWEKELTRYFSRHTWRDTAWLAEAFAGEQDRDSMHMLAWRAACGISRASAAAAAECEGASADGPEDSSRHPEGGDTEPLDGSVERMMDGLREFALCRTALCERIYREEAIREMPDVLPEEYRGAYAILNLLERTEAAQYAEAVESVREIKDLLPGLANIMRYYLKWLDTRLERQKRESTQAAGEFQVLARQIKARVYALMDAGQYEAALGVTEQLLPLLPGDGELRSLREKIAGRIGNR